MSLKSLFTLSLLSSFVDFAHSSSSKNVRVRTKLGELRGFLSDPYPESDGQRAEIYLNIPYALPPLGSLRFEKPQPYNQTWPTGRDALKFGPSCVPLLNDGLPISEDCLTLNIFRPHQKRSTDTLPILVYVHGGGYGFMTALLYGYQQLANNYVSQDMIVVTLQYRLGFFGFASSGDSALPGNLGLWDQAMAFRWINENIASFGGDPKRVTAQGLSAGAASVGLLSLSPHSRDYISKTVEMSGAAVATWAISAETAEFTRKFAQKVGCPTESSLEMKQCFKSRSTDLLLTNTAEFTKPTPKFLQFTPILDGDFFPTGLDRLLVEAPKIPNLIGITALETHYFVVLNKDPPINSIAVPHSEQSHYNHENLENYVKNFTHWFDYIFQNKKPLVQHELLRFYTRGDRERRTDQNFFYLQRFNELTADFFFNLPALKFAQARAAAGWPTYFYLNSHFNPAQFPDGTPFQSSTHANEYPYMNGLFPVGEFEFDEEDRQFQSTFNRVIADFAKTGLVL